MRKNGKAYRKLYLSYVCIFYIPIIMGVLFYSYAYRDAKKHADISNESLIRTVKNTCDRELEYYENELIQLALDENIQQLSAVCGNFGVFTVFFNFFSRFFIILLHMVARYKMIAFT